MAKTRAEALAAVAARYPHTTPATPPPSRLPPYTPEQLSTFLSPAPPLPLSPALALALAPAQLTMFGVVHAITH